MFRSPLFFSSQLPYNPIQLPVYVNVREKKFIRMSVFIRNTYPIALEQIPEVYKSLERDRKRNE